MGSYGGATGREGDSWPERTQRVGARSVVRRVHTPAVSSHVANRRSPQENIFAPFLIFLLFSLFASLSNHLFLLGVVRASRRSPCPSTSSPTNSLPSSRAARRHPRRRLCTWVFLLFASPFTSKLASTRTVRRQRSCILFLPSLISFSVQLGSPTLCFAGQGADAAYNGARRQLASFLDTRPWAQEAHQRTSVSRTLRQVTIATSLSRAACAATMALPRTPILSLLRRPLPPLSTPSMQPTLPTLCSATSALTALSSLLAAGSARSPERLRSDWLGQHLRRCAPVWFCCRRWMHK